MIAVVDAWSFYHFIGGIVMGVVAYNFLKPSHRLDFVIALPLFWELVENNVLASWLGFLSVEPLANAACDILITFIGGLLGLRLATMNIKPKRRRT